MYGVSDFVGGLKTRSVSLPLVLFVSQGTGLAITVVAVLAFAGDVPDGERLAYGAAAGACEIVGLSALYHGLARGTMGIVAPVGALAPAVAVIAGLVIGDAPSALQWAGMALAVGAIVAVSLGPAPAGSTAALGVGASVLFGLLSALGLGGYQVSIDAASNGGVLWGLLFARITAAALACAILLIVRPKISESRAELPAVALIGALVFVSDTTFAIATTKGLLSVVAVLGSLYPVVTVVLARIYLGERLRRFQQVAIAACLVGVVAIAV
jgi:drug/metabolite transporter (DMT)-like permease